MGLPERSNIFPCASMQLLWKSTTPNKGLGPPQILQLEGLGLTIVNNGISQTDSFLDPKNDVVFRGDVVSLEKEGPDGFLRQLAANDLLVILRDQGHFGTFEHKIHVEI